MEKLYKVTFKNRFKHFWEVYIYLLLDIIFIFYMIYRHGYQDIDIYLKIAVCMFLLIFVPTLYVHIEYYIINYKDKLFVDFQTDKLKYFHKGKNIDFHLRDVKLLKIYKTPPLIENRLPWLPWATYNYVIIKLNNGKKIFITCFLVNELNLNIPSSKKRLVKVLFPYIRR